MQPPANVPRTRSGLLIQHVRGEKTSWTLIFANCNYELLLKLYHDIIIIMYYYYCTTLSGAIVSCTAN